MASSSTTTSSSSSSSSNCRCRRNNKYKKTARKPPQINNNNSVSPNPIIHWNSHTQTQIYSSKLLRSLRHLRPNPTASSNLKMPMRVRDAANGLLAATARRRWRWSRAILKNRLKCYKFIKRKNASSKQHHRRQLLLDNKKKSKLRLTSIRVRELGRLVPGCRKLPLHVLLEEATEYIPALQMQVRAMSALAELLSNSSA